MKENKREILKRHNPIEAINYSNFRKQHKKYEDKYRETHRIKIRKIGRKYRNEIKLKVLGHYCRGEPKCKMCGYNNTLALQIHHINHDGNIWRKNTNRRGGIRYYQWLMENHYPKGHQVLCANCNSIKEQRKRIIERNMNDR